VNKILYSAQCQPEANARPSSRLRRILSLQSSDDDGYIFALVICVLVMVIKLHCVSKKGPRRYRL